MGIKTKVFLAISFLLAMAGAVYSGVVAADKTVRLQTILVNPGSSLVTVSYLVNVTDLDGTILTKNATMDYSSAFSALMQNEALTLVNAKEGK